MVGITTASMSNIETGETKSLKASTLMRLAAALDVDPLYIETGNGEPRKLSEMTAPSQVEIVAAIQKLSPSAQAALLAAAQAMLRSEQEHT